MPRTRKPQKAKTCAMPGTVHLSSLRWPSTSVASASTRLRRVRRAADGRLARPRERDEEPAALDGEGEQDDGDSDADDGAQEHVIHGPRLARPPVPRGVCEAGPVRGPTGWVTKLTSRDPVVYLGVLVWWPIVAVPVAGPAVPRGHAAAARSSWPRSSPSSWAVSGSRLWVRCRSDVPSRPAPADLPAAVSSPYGSSRWPCRCVRSPITACHPPS